MVVQDRGGLHTDLILSVLQFVGSFLIYDFSNSLFLSAQSTYTRCGGWASSPAQTWQNQEI